MTRTNALTVLCVIIRAFAALAAVKLAMAIPAVLAPSAAYADFSTALRVSTVLVPLSVIAFMWLFPDWLAKVAIARRSGEVFETDIDARTCLTVALAVVATITLVDTIVDSFRLLFLHLAIARAEDGATHYPVDFGVDVWTSVVGLAVGGALLLGSRGIAALIFRIRFGSAAPPPKAAADRLDES